MKIFIINLQRSLQRKSTMLEKIAKIQPDDFPVEFIFFHAIDGSAGQHIQFSAHFHRIFASLYRGFDLSDSEKSCYASHFCLWQECVRLNEAIVILEDDIVLNDNFIDGLHRITSSHYEYVRLTGTFMHGKTFICLDNPFYTTWHSVCGTQGYYVTPAAARKFSAARYWVLPVDNYMDRACMHGVKTVIHLPVLIQGNDELTTILRKNCISPFWKLVREIFRPFIQLKMKWYILWHH